MILQDRVHLGEDGAGVGRTSGADGIEGGQGFSSGVSPVLSGSS